MVCASRKTFARALAWAQTERSEVWTQVNDRAKEKKIVQVRVGRTHNNCVERYELM